MGKSIQDMLTALDDDAPIILDLCGGTGGWSAPYANADYQVITYDLKTGTDIRLLEYDEGVFPKVHGILAAPPCTHFCISGAKYWKQKGIQAIYEGLSIVDACLRVISICHPKWWALENPVGRLRKWLGPPTLIFDPYEYGDDYKKKTCLWGNFNPPKKCPGLPSDINHHSKFFNLPPEERMTMRSITPPEFAKAFFKANP